MTDVELLRALGGKVGSKLIGDEGHGPEVIQITAVGEEKLLAKVVRNAKGKPIERYEGVWTLAFRDWALLEA